MIEDVRQKLARWQQDYNLGRPHSALAGLAPAAFVAEWVAATTPTDQEAPELLETLP
jgi:hypothetical protein